MTVIEWKPGYETGIAIIDQRHREIIAVARELDMAMLGGKAYDVLEGLLYRLITITDLHFREEERLMAFYLYPDLKLHKQEHHQIRKDLFQLLKGFNQNNLPFAPIKIKAFLKSWIDNHLLRVDNYYVEFFQENSIEPDDLMLIDVFQEKKIEDIDFY